MNGLITSAGLIAILLAAGAVFALLDRAHFNPRWLAVAALLVAINDALVPNFYGLLPDLIGGTWLWQGKLLSLLATLAIAALPMFGWRRVGLTLAQEPGSLKTALPVVALYCAFFVVIAFVFPDEPASAEDIAFQLTMPGLEEEPFYRGTLLFALDQAFGARKRMLGVDWGWGALLSCLVFGLEHALSFSNGAFACDFMTLALTGGPALLGVWVRLRTGSLLLPVLLHNFGNSFSLLV